MTEAEALKKLGKVRFGTSSAAKRQRKYMRGVLDGSITACKWTRLAVMRSVREHSEGAPKGHNGQKYYFDPGRADRVCDFTEALIEPKFDGVTTLELLPWQCFVSREVFGWVADEKLRGQEFQLRRYRDAYIWVARKAGKSTLAAAWMLYVFLMEPFAKDGRRERGAEAYTFATTRDQAKIAFNLAKSAINNPAMPRLLGCKVGAHAITAEGGLAECKALAANHDSLDGHSPSYGLGDEIHAHPIDDSLRQVIRTGMGARRQPLMVSTTTAGNDRDNPAFSECESAKMLLEGDLAVSRPDYFTILFTVDDEDLENVETNTESWAKSNPSLGHITSLSDLKSEHAAAMVDRYKLQRFLQRRLNVWSDKADGFLDMPAFRDCIVEGLGWDSFDPAHPVFIGVDCGQTRDLTAAAGVQMLWEDGDIVKLRIVASCFIPDAMLDMRHGALGKIYREAEGDPAFIKTRGQTTNQKILRQFISQQVRKHNIPIIGVDPHQSEMLQQELAELHPDVKVAAFSQNAKVFTEPLQRLEMATMSRVVEWSGSPLLDWQFSNLQIKAPPDSPVVAIRPIKPGGKDSKAKIDAAVAALIGIAAGLVHIRQPKAGWVDPREYLK